MEHINLLCLTDGFNNLQEYFLNFKKYFGLNIDDDELKDLSQFVNQISLFEPPAQIYDKYYIGYSIPQISKEFDLLRICDKYIINIELKRIFKEDKVKKQLLENSYYLKFADRTIYNFTYVVSEQALYKLDEYEDLSTVDLKNLISHLSEQKFTKSFLIDDLFNPSNYLVSPFNTPKKFLARQYFLNGQQREFKQRILKEFDVTGPNLMSITGVAGSGKTLLIYDIAMTLRQMGNKVLIVHCGKSNEGIEYLKNKEWDVICIKSINQETLSKYTTIIIDESQRIRTYQLEAIIQEIERTRSNLLFSYDQKQCLHVREMNNNISNLIKYTYDSKELNLSTKIRTNHDVSNFIKHFLGESNSSVQINEENIKIVYFNKLRNIKTYLKTQIHEDWTYINLTPSSYNTYPYDDYHMIEEKNTHDVIGQEFDNIIVVIDSHFYYKSDGKLSTRRYPKSPYYHPTKMLYQNLSRARKRIQLVVYDNPLVLKRCIEILMKLPN